MKKWIRGYVRPPSTQKFEQPQVKPDRTSRPWCCSDQRVRQGEAIFAPVETLGGRGNRPKLEAILECIRETINTGADGGCRKS